MDEIAIRVCDLEKRYRVWTHAPPTNLKERLAVAGAAIGARLRIAGEAQFRQEVHALRGVSFDVRRGEVLGVIGRNGAGKSTLLSILARITEPTGGYAEMHGRVSSLLEVGTGFHPELSGRDNVFLNGAILGMARAETARKFDEIVEFAGVREFIDIPVKRYSSGMQVRLAFAVAAHLDPEILLLDEVLAVGDAQFQARSHARVKEMTSNGRTVLFVSHDVNAVARLCRRAIMLEHGRVVYEGPASETVEAYLAVNRANDPGAGAHTGTGALRVRRVAVSSVDGSTDIRSGDPVTFTVDLDSEGRLSEPARVTLAIKTTDGAELIRLATQLTDWSPSLECAIDSLPLNAGTYVVGALIEQNGRLVDEVATIAEFSVSVAGVSGAAKSTAPVLVNHSWSVESVSSAVAETGGVR
jgi:lipopolysaccharide transport system ATP-binding protein